MMATDIYLPCFYSIYVVIVTDSVEMVGGMAYCVFAPFVGNVVNIGSNK